MLVESSTIFNARSNICTVPNLTFTFVIIRKGAKNTTFRGHVGGGGGELGDMPPKIMIFIDAIP